MATISKRVQQTTVCDDGRVVLPAGHMTHPSLLKVFNVTRNTRLKDEGAESKLAVLTEAERVNVFIWKHNKTKLITVA